MMNLPSRWKYGLVAVLAVLGISSAGSYYTGSTHSIVDRPEPTAIYVQVKGAEALSVTPTSSPLIRALIPSISPTSAYVPATQVPASQTDNQTDGSVPAGASAKCSDGTYSFSQHHSGTCSHHGGVAQWL